MVYLFWFLSVLACLGVAISYYNYGFLFGFYWFGIGVLTALGVLDAICGYISLAIPQLMPLVVAVISILILNWTDSKTDGFGCTGDLDW